MYNTGVPWTTESTQVKGWRSVRAAERLIEMLPVAAAISPVTVQPRISTASAAVIPAARRRRCASHLGASRSAMPTTVRPMSRMRAPVVSRER
jgi:hypothetical protein